MTQPPADDAPTVAGPAAPTGPPPVRDPPPPDDQALAYLRVFRPLAPALCAAAYLAVWAVAPSRTALSLVLVLAFSVAVGVTYALASRALAPRAVLLPSLVVDMAIVGALVATLDRPAVATGAFLWSVVITAYFLSWKDTVALGVLATACAVVVPLRFNEEPVATIEVASAGIIVAVISALLAFVAGRGRSGEAQLARERLHDRIALQLAERVMSADDVEALLARVPEQVGQQMDVDRCTLRLFDSRSREASLFEWHRPALRPLAEGEPLPAAIVDRLRQGVVAVVEDAQREDSPLGRYMRAAGSSSLVGTPLFAGGRLLATLSLQDNEPGTWPRHAVPVLQRLSPLLTGTILQAQALAEQRDLALMREQVIARASHELRTPLTATLGFLDTLQRTDVDFTPAQRAQFLALATQGAERLSLLVRDLSDLNVLRRGSVAMRPEPTDLHELVERAIDSIPRSADRTVLLEGERDVRAHADPDRVEQLVANLVGNALRHGKGTVRVRCAAEGDEAVVEVTDEGPGLPAGAEHTAFEPFTSWSDRTDSSGLGLAIAQGIAEANGGELQYLPAEADVPHRFQVRLPTPGG